MFLGLAIVKARDGSVCLSVGCRSRIDWREGDGDHQIRWPRNSLEAVQETLVRFDRVEGGRGVEFELSVLVLNGSAMYGVGSDLEPRHKQCLLLVSYTALF